MTEEGWDSITNAICSKTSIMETYLSNHTLNDIISLEPLPVDLKRWLNLNGALTTSQVARLKIMDTHFPESDISIDVIRPFLAMDMNLLPQAMNWVGKYDEIAWGYWTVMYEIVRHSPLFVEHGADYSVYSKMRSPMKKRQRII